jgi:hypothetical protein
MAYLISHFWHGWAAVRREWPGGRVAESLDESEYLQLISAARVGRLGYTSRYGPAVLPVVYKAARRVDRFPHPPGHIHRRGPAYRYRTH